MTSKATSAPRSARFVPSDLDAVMVRLSLTLSTLALSALALSAWALCGVSSASAQACDQTPKRCDRENARFEREVQQLARANPDAANALQSIRHRRLSACYDYNVCGISSDQLEAVERWASSELTMLRAISSPEARTTWARGVAMRGNAIAQVTAEQARAMRPQLTDAVRRSIVSMRADVESLEALQPLLPRIRAGIEGNPPGACSGDLRERLRAIIRQGGTADSNARYYKGKLDDLCERFERQAEPDEALRNRIRRFVAHVDRIENWMGEISRCVDPGPYDGRCRNAYGERRDDTLEQTRRAMRVVRNVRRVLGDDPPNRPFPCSNAIWRRLEESQWTLRTAQAQIPSLAQNAKRLCDSIGVEPSELAELRTQINQRLEQDIARTREWLTQRRESLARMREAYGLED